MMVLTGCKDNSLPHIYSDSKVKLLKLHYLNSFVQMKTMLVLAGILLNAFISCAQQMDCKPFRNGLFKMESESTWIINRNGNLQTETAEGSNDTASFVVNWIDDCTYTLTPTEETLKLKKVSGKNTVTVRIIETRPSSYIQISVFEDNPELSFVNEIVKVTGNSAITGKKKNIHPGSFPDYTEAVKHFFDVTPLSDYINPEIKFQKKVEGWFAQITSDSLDTVRVKIWDSSKLLYADTVIRKDTATSISELRKKKLDSDEKTYYDVCPYFGYQGWERDVIKNYAGYNGTDANFTYGIGRAYASMADNLLSDRNDMAETSQIFKFKSLDTTLIPQ